MHHRNDRIASDIEGYLHEHEHKELLRFITCGSVDDGKSTLIGRLLHDTKMIFEDHLATLESESRRIGTTGEKLDLALLVDGLQSEREQGITIDVAYRYFSTEKRKFIIADTPGHEQYTRNMATGASTADTAVILIDARYGIGTQTRRHSLICRLMGIRNVIVAVNKMDVIGFDEGVFTSIDEQYRQFAEQLGFESVFTVPLSALEGDNVVGRSPNTPWYTGETLLDLLESIPLSQPSPDAPFRMAVQYVNRPNLDFRGYAGTVSSGTVRVGDALWVLPSRKRGTVKSIEVYEGQLPFASTGKAVTLTLNEEIDISRGNLLIKADDTMEAGDVIEADLVWMDEAGSAPGRSYLLKRASTLTTARIDSIEYRIDVNTHEKLSADSIGFNDIVTVQIALGEAIGCDSYEANRQMGGFILIDRMTNNTVAAGMIRSVSGQRERSGGHSAFEVELNALIRRHFPHWNAAVIE